MIDSDEMKTLKFQSALPMKGATFKIASVKAYFGISIRAPNERSDRSAVKRLKIRIYFNPRSQ